ncbi:hypothetical protein RDWZM_007847 [Blomia tropicalis]|uniref:Uncharacterized protein n=1 Tax=Blomia tropicalis TaxID=40697 RepID=A0A9Q0LZV8_BLOTA|nr:hypothetical protein RDWZM_007847 [Blomia tropicalis]
MNGHYPMSNNGDIVDLYDTVTSMETDPTTNKITIKGKLKLCKIQECDYLNKFLVKDICFITLDPGRNSIIEHCEWYPKDSGMLSILQPQKYHIMDANRCDIVNTFDLDQSAHSTHWNVCDPFISAIAYNIPSVKLFDIRTCDAISTIVLSSRIQIKGYRPTRVYWSPLDTNGLFIGDSCGDIFFYDTRFLNKPCGKQAAPVQKLFLPVVYIGMSPDNVHLITTHGSSCQVTQWNFSQNRDEMLIDTNLNCHTRNKESHSFHKKTKLNILCTMDRIYTPNLYNYGPDVFCFDRKTGQRLLNHELKHHLSQRPILQVIGYRRTMFGDDPNPAIIYSGINHIVVSRMSIFSEPLNEDETSIHGNDGSFTKIKSRDHLTSSILHQDRWSDSDD